MPSTFWQITIVRVKVGRVRQKIKDTVRFTLHSEDHLDLLDSDKNIPFPWNLLVHNNYFKWYISQNKTENT